MGEVLGSFTVSLLMRWFDLPWKWTPLLQWMVIIDLLDITEYVFVTHLDILEGDGVAILNGKI